MGNPTLRFENGTEITTHGAFRPDNTFVTSVGLAEKMTEI